MTVVRNSAYKRGGLNKRERHNERKNIDYMNDDICPERAVYNVHYKQCTDGYEQTVDRMIADGAVSTRGLGKDPNIVDELVFDVNTSYFERNGGYEFAKTFYEEVYRMAVKLVGGERYILSAVMHADERNSEVSDKLGRDVYHYHLHVVYVPVVRKEVYFKKNNPNPELAGKLREVITQISHSKKWPKEKKLDENGEIVRTKNGKAVLVNSYSTLQDDFFNHMRAAGYDDLERGVRGSTADHLSVLEFKTQKEKERADAVTAEVEAKQEAAATLDTAIQGKTQAVAELDEQTERKKKQITDLDKKTAYEKQKAVSFADIDKMSETKTMLGDIALSHTNWRKLSGLAKEGIESRSIIANLKKSLADTKNELKKAKEPNSDKGMLDYLKIFRETSDYREAMKRYPQEVKEFLTDIMRRGHPQREVERGLNRGDAL
jgi:hypothetical protein